MSSTSLVRAIVSVGSLPDSLAFYVDVIGLKVKGRVADMATLDLGDSELFLHQRPPRPSDAGVALCFAVDGVDPTVQGWQKQGGIVIDPPADQPWGERMAVVRDPDGHVVCLAAKQ